MQHVTRIIVTLLLATVTFSGAARAAQPAPQGADYKRTDTNFYWKGDVLKVEPTAVIVALTDVTQKGDLYTFAPKGKAPKEIYVQVVNDWIEPITPPDMPASLGVAPDAMQIREPQGDVQVTVGPNPLNFVKATEGMLIPNDTEVKTGANSTAAILIGGVESARLIPNTDVSVSQTVTPQARTTRVILTRGAVFSKVGQQIGVTEDYQVKTPFGVAAARGTDFVTIAMPARTDVWIAQGTVQLDQPDGKMVGSVSSDGGGPLKIVRNPPMPDAHATMMASAETMTAAMNFIPLANVKLKALRAKVAQGVKLTPNEQAYLDRIKHVPCLIKLALVEMAPPPPPAVVAVAPAPGPGATIASPNPATGPAAPEPVLIELADSGTMQIFGQPVTADALADKLKSIAKTNASQPILVVADDKVPHPQVDQVLGLCKAAKLTHVKRVKTLPPVPAPAPVKAGTPAAAMTPPSAKPGPVDLDLREDGKVDFQGDTLTLDQLKPKLEAVGGATPDQAILVKGRDKAPKGQVKKVLDLAKAAKLKNVTVDKSAPVVAAVPAPPAPPTPPAPAAPPASAPASPTGPPPLTIEVRADGKVEFQGSTLSLDDLKPKLDALAKVAPDQPLVIKRREKLEKGQVRKVVDLCHSANLQKVTVDRTPPPVAGTPGAPPPTSPAPQVAAPPPPPAPAPAKPQLPPAMLIPMNLQLRPDGKVNFQSATLSMNDLKLKIEELGLVAPKQPLVITGRATAAKGQLKKVLAMCQAAQLREVTVAKAEPRTTLVALNGTATAPEMTRSTATTSSTAPAPASTRVATTATASAPTATKPKTKVAATRTAALTLPAVDTSVVTVP